MSGNPFFDAAERERIDAFLERGYLRFSLDDHARFESLRARLHRWGCAALGREIPLEAFFDETAAHVATTDLNEFRLTLIRELNADETIRPLLYQLAREPLHLLVGNELAMQRGLNLSIQLPDDDSSLLPLHSDIWSGNSPYEVVFWLPLTPVYRTRSMYLLPKPASDAIYADFSRYSQLSAEALFEEIARDLVWIELTPGEGLIFWHGLIHGNRVNREPKARWSMNVRFKGLLTPYGRKELGESFMPITTRAMTRIGYAYRQPQ